MAILFSTPLTASTKGDITKFVACAAAIGGLAYSYLQPEFKPKPEEIERRSDPSASNLSVAIDKSPSRELARHFFGTFGIAKVMMERRMVEHLSGQGTLRALTQQDYRYVLGYFLIYVSLRKFARTFINIDFDDFLRASELKMKPNPNKVLYLSSIGSKDPLSNFPEFHFDEQYGNQPNAKFMFFSEIDDLLGKLSAMPQDESYDRIEIFMHGTTGKLYGANRSQIKSTELAKVRNAGLRIAAPGADIRFISCSVAAGTPLNAKASEGLIREFGLALLCKGGQAHTASRNITIFSGQVPPQFWHQRKSAETGWVNRSMGGVIHFMGFGNFRYAWYVILPGAYRNYITSLKDVTSLEIPATRE